MKKLSYQYVEKRNNHPKNSEDEYFWLRDIKNEVDGPLIKELLSKENDITKDYLKSHSSLENQIFEEMKSRELEEYSTCPYKHGEYHYYERYEKNKEYAIHCRKKIGSDIEEICLDENELAKGLDYFDLGVFDPSSDHKILAYTVDTNGSEMYTLKFKNLETGEIYNDEIHNVAHSVSWYKDLYSVVYVVQNEDQRPFKVMQHNLGSADDTELFTEESGEYFVGVNESLDHEYIFITSNGSTSNTSYYLSAKDINARPELIEPRRDKIEYYATHKNGYFYILSNDTHHNFRIIRRKIGSNETEEVIAPDDNIYINDIECYKSFNAISYRENGLPKIKLIFNDDSEHIISFPEPSYNAYSGDNAEFDTNLFRYDYSSLTRPLTTYELDITSKKSKEIYFKEVPGFDSSKYTVERVSVPSHDKASVPMSILRRHEDKLDGKSSVLLYGYGSYGMNVDPAFRSKILSLVDRGFIFAIAHIRGSSTLGRFWYEEGKFLKKKNSFYDFIACGEYLIQNKYTSKGQIAINGGSAGGMLVGAAINIAPEGMFKVAIAEVPFVDVLNTMMDSSLPLTQLEYEEWGNPNDKEYFDYIKSYSPYDNIEKKDYPSILATGGLNDPRVTYWEPMKWIYRLRDHATDHNPKLLYMNMGAGHAGASGRYEYMKEDAMIQTFILKEFGIES